MADPYFEYTTAQNEALLAARRQARHMGESIEYYPPPPDEYVEPTINWEKPPAHLDNDKIDQLRYGGDSIERIYKRIMAQNAGAMIQLGDQWYRVLRVLEDVHGRVNKAALGLKYGGDGTPGGTGWTGQGADAFLARGPGATLKSLDDWKEAVRVNWLGAYSLAGTIARWQGEMAALWEQYKAAIVARSNELINMVDKPVAEFTDRQKDNYVRLLRTEELQWSERAQQLQFSMAREYWSVMSEDFAGGRATVYEGPSDAVRFNPDFLRRYEMSKLPRLPGRLPTGTPEVGQPASVAATSAVPDPPAPLTAPNLPEPLAGTIAPGAPGAPGVPGVPVVPQGLAGAARAAASRTDSRAASGAFGAEVGGLGGPVGRAGLAGSAGLAGAAPPLPPAPPRVGGPSGPSNVLRGKGAGQMRGPDAPPPASTMKGQPPPASAMKGEPPSSAGPGRQPRANEFGTPPGAPSAPVLRSPAANGAPPPAGGRSGSRQPPPAKGETRADAVPAVLRRHRPPASPVPPVLENAPQPPTVGEGLSMPAPPRTAPVVGRAARAEGGQPRPPERTAGVLRAGRRSGAAPDNAAQPASRRKDQEETQARLDAEFDKIRQLLDAEEAWVVPTPGGGVLDGTPARATAPVAEPKPSLGR